MVVENRYPSELTDEGPRRAEFSDLVGEWIEDVAFDEIVAAQRRIDPDIWE